MAKAYIECNVLELKEYSFIHRDKDHLIYMIKNIIIMKMILK